MKKTYFKLIALVLIVVFASFSAIAQKGNVKGVIKDADNKSLLPGANVVIEGTTNGTATDMDGEYFLSGLPVGSHTLLVKFLGYEEKKIQIEVKDNETLKLNVELAVASIMGDEVIITAQMLGQSKAINQQLNSDAIMNAVSEDKLKELPDVNAAEAIGRISGVSLIRSQGEGQKVVIRGLDPKYSAITINGVKAPSNSSTDKSVDLSMISPDLLAGIEVYKSPTPDMDAEAVGGTVNLVIKKAPEEPKLNIKLSNGYNIMHKDMKDYNFSANYTRRFFDNKLGIIIGGNLERVNRSSDGFDGRYSTAQITNEDGELIDIVEPTSIALIDVTEIRKRGGASINVDYSLKNGSISVYSFYNVTNRDVLSKQNLYSPNGATDTYTSYQLQSQEMKTSLFSNMLSGTHNLSIIKADWSLSYAKTINERPHDVDMQFRNINAYDGALLDRTTPNFNNWMNLADKDYNNSNLHKLYFNPNEVWEKNYTAAVNLEVPIKLGEKISGSIKFGGKYNSTDRLRDESQQSEEFYYLGTDKMNNAINAYPEAIKLNDKGLISMNNMIDDSYEEEEFLKGDYEMINPLSEDAVNKWYNSQKDLLTEDRTVTVSDYDLNETVTAGYIMAKLKFGKSLTIITGGRIESSDNTYNAFYSTLSGFYGATGTIRDTTTYQKYTEFFPHFHLKFEPVKWWDLRFSVAKTMARPDYEYVTPRTYVNANRNEITAGRPDLKYMTSMNYDLSMSFYSNDFGLFSIGGFYKNMENIFYKMDNYYLASDDEAAKMGYPSRRGFYLDSYENSDNAAAYGLEFELQTNLRFLPAPFNGIVLSANLTKLFSETSTYFYNLEDSIYRDPKTMQVVKDSWVVENKRDIRIPGQVPLIFNLSIGYDYKGFSCRISGNYQGEYLRFPGTTSLNDNRTPSFWRWDFALKQKITKNFDIFFNANNLNNMREEQYRNGEERYPRSILEYGTILSYGLKITL